MEKKYIIPAVAIILVIVAAGAIKYMFRPLAAPSHDGRQFPGQQGNRPPGGGPPGGPENTTPVTISPNAADPVVAPAGTTIFTISSTDSTAQFSIGEVLRGSDFTAVGTTTHVSGEIALDPKNPKTAKIGTIKINARTFKTESTSRDRMIGRFILKSEEADKEFITFTPTTLGTLPASIVVGKAFNVSITGDLTMNGVTKPATFAGSATLVDATHLTATATSIVKHKDYNLVIPSVPSVASVNEEVELKITLTAVAKTDAETK